MDVCPECGVSFLHEYEDGPVSRRILLTDPYQYDGSIAWMCPDCKHKELLPWAEKLDFKLNFDMDGLPIVLDHDLPFYSEAWDFRSE